MTLTPKKILIVDDEQDICVLLKTLIELHKNSDGEQAFEAELFTSGNDCIKYLKDGSTADLVISDIRVNHPPLKGRACRET